AEVTGMPYERYIQEYILDPLDMNHTTAWEPLPEPLRSDLAASYQFSNGGYEPIPFIFDVTVPDGSISASAIDMTHFMIAHLQDGQYGNSRILLPDTARLMHSRSFSHHPRMDGWAHGFEEFTINGRRTLTHNGGWEGFSSYLMLLPEQGLGLFVSYNSPGGFGAVDEMLQAFFDRYYPASAAPASPPSANPDRPARQFAGWYKPVRSSSTTLEKIVTLISALPMTALDDGTLEFVGRKWTAVDSLLYRQTDGKELMAFLPGERGAAAYAAIGVSAFEKIPWYETPGFNLIFLGCCLLVLVTAPIGWLASSIHRRLGKQPQIMPPAASRAARWAAGIGSGLCVMFIAAVGISLMGDISEFVYGIPLGFRLLMAVPFAIAALTAAALVLAVAAWKNRNWSFWGLVHYTLVAAAMTGVLWFANTWNLLGFRFG
ncbi:MAG: serine hydrolase domain-containing protein, partial [Anaerolineales bacterium]